MRDNGAEAVVISALRARLARSQDGVLEAIAAEHGASTRAVADCLPDHCRTTVDGSAFEAVMADLSEWGEVTLLVHTKDVVLECRGEVPRGRVARGFYNLDGHAAMAATCVTATAWRSISSSGRS